MPSNSFNSVSRSWDGKMSSGQKLALAAAGCVTVILGGLVASGSSNKAEPGSIESAKNVHQLKVDNALKSHGMNLSGGLQNKS